MKKILLVAILLARFIFPTTAGASSLACYQVDGMAIFGYDGSEWIHIGAIGNEYNSLSIANEYGAGNEYKSTSIFNEYGRYGGEYSSYSALNEYATKPPIIVNNDYKFVGYLTVDDYKTPGINSYEALACAKDSFRTPNSDMVNVTFKDIPDRSYSSYSSYSSAPAYTPPAPATPSCPVNSIISGTSCQCNEGFVINGAKNACIPLNEYCQSTFGTNSHGVGNSCYCAPGYQWNSSQTSCEVIQNNSTAQPVSPNLAPQSPKVLKTEPPELIQKTTINETAKVESKSNKKVSVEAKTETNKIITVSSSTATTTENKTEKVSWVKRLWRFLFK